MSGKDSPPRFRLPLGAILVLALCACGLAVHFVVEGLAGLAGPSAFELAARGEQMHPLQEHCDDGFVFPLLVRLPADHTLAQPASLGAASAFSLSIPPLLPPPNSHCFLHKHLN